MEVQVYNFALQPCYCQIDFNCSPFLFVRLLCGCLVALLHFLFGYERWKNANVLSKALAFVCRCFSSVS